MLAIGKQKHVMLFLKRMAIGEMEAASGGHSVEKCDGDRKE